MYGKLHQRKLKEKDYQLSCESAREELQEYIDAEAKRVNIDSAKKLAVMQHMDYDGFRQMVLGANIFPSKAGQLQTAALIDHSLPQNKLYAPSKQDISHSLALSQSESICNSFRDLKHKFNHYYQRPLDLESAEMCYNLIKIQNENQIKKIFNIQCEAIIIVKIADVFMYVLSYMEEKKHNLFEEAIFQKIFLQKVLKFQSMEMPLSVLSKKQKNIIDVAIKRIEYIMEPKIQRVQTMEEQKKETKQQIIQQNETQLSLELKEAKE